MPYEILTIPIPERPTRGKHAKGVSKYPFASLEVGQSFVVPNKAELTNLPLNDGAKAVSLGSVQSLVHRWNTVLGEGKHFKCAVSSTDNRYIQVWRES